jgi:hypothetical protein
MGFSFICKLLSRSLAGISDHRQSRWYEEGSWKEPLPVVADKKKWQRQKHPVFCHDRFLTVFRRVSSFG